MISLDWHSDKILKSFFFKSHKNQDEISYLSKMSYLINIFDIILPNLDPRQEDKNMAKNKQGTSQIYDLVIIYKNNL